MIEWDDIREEAQEYAEDNYGRELDQAELKILKDEELDPAWLLDVICEGVDRVMKRVGAESLPFDCSPPGVGE